MKRLGIFFLCIGLLLAPGFALAEESARNIAVNGEFEQVADDGMPEGWGKDMWLFDEGYTYVDVSDDAYSGSHAARIESVVENDARITQSVSVEPGQIYRLSVMVKSQNVKGGGISIAIGENYERSESILGTDGEWMELVCYAQAGEEQRTAVVWLRLGYYGENTTGIALFDDFSMTPVAAAPEGAALLSLLPDENLGRAAESEEDGEAEQGESVSQPGREKALLVLVSILYALAFLYGHYHIKRSRFKDSSAKIGMFAIFIYSFFMRMVIAYTQPGYAVDVSCFISWGNRFATEGPFGFYAGEYFCDYPPLYMMVLGLISGIRHLFGLDGHDAMANVIMRLIPSLCDLGLAYLLYRVARRRHGEKAGALLGAGYALSPAFIAATAAWGQIDTVLLFLLFVSIEFILDKKYRVGLVTFAVAMLVKPQALMLAPMGVIKLVCDVAFAKEEERKKRLGRILAGTGMALGVLLAVSLLFQGEQSFFWLVEKYAETLSSYPYVVLNSYNLYGMLGMNWVELSPAMGALGTVVIVLMVAFGGAAYFASARRRKGSYAYQLYLCCAVVIIGIFMFGMKMHERYILLGIAMLFAAYAHKRDTRVLVLALVYSMTSFVNVMRVLYLEHLPVGLDLFTSVMSLINVLATLYLFYLVITSCMLGWRKEPARELTPSAYGPDYLRPAEYKLRMNRREALFLAGLTLVYGVLAFTNLGEMTAPESEWRSTAVCEVVAVDLGEVRDLDTIYYYGGVGEGRFGIQISEDGVHWKNAGMAEYPLYKMFRWLPYKLDGSGNETPEDNRADAAREEGELFAHLAALPLASYDAPWPEEREFSELDASAERTSNYAARYVRLTFMSPGIPMFEIAFGGADGAVYPIAQAVSAGYTEGRAWDVAALFDEQDEVPERISHYNGTYFDEIYHANTAYEHLHDLKPHETSHPPLGKLMISVGISLFGMTPFGWRFSGAFIGVLMVPVMYLLARQVFKRPSIAMIITLLFTFDFMHFVQTRIATIDSFGVFFVMAMYLFMLRYAKMNFYRDGVAKTLPTLGLCGLMFGLGAASKWICLYAGAGLAVIFFILMGMRLREYLYARGKIAEGSASPMDAKVARLFPKYLAITLACCVGFFIVIPAAIYYASYIPYFSPTGGITLERVLEAQSSMFNYHDGLSSNVHPYASAWWQWPLIERPMWYYSGNFAPDESLTASISAFGNPAVWWTGFLAVLYLVWHKVRGTEHLDAPRPLQERPASIFWVVVIGAIFQYAPWILVTRSMFIYHYFATIPFLMLFIGYALELWERKQPKALRRGWIVAGVAMLLFAMYYPLLTGTPVAKAYANWLNILPRWNLFWGVGDSPWIKMWNAIGSFTGFTF